MPLLTENERDFLKSGISAHFVLSMLYHYLKLTAGLRKETESDRATIRIEALTNELRCPRIANRRFGRSRYRGKVESNAPQDGGKYQYNRETLPTPESSWVMEASACGNDTTQCFRSWHRSVACGRHRSHPKAKYNMTVSTAKYSAGNESSSAMILPHRGRDGHRIKAVQHAVAKATNIITPGN